MMITNSDVLTKGRQTWDCIKSKSVPYALAYQVMAEVFKNNLN